MGVIEPTNKNIHYNQIDSLRGLAAAIVVVHHYLLIFPWFPLTSDPFSNYLSFTNQIGPISQLVVQCINNSPFHIFWAGQEAVLLFFILSGFVLSIPFYRGHVPYSGFIIRRIFRIYIPYIMAIFIAYFIRESINPHGIENLSRWFNAFWLGGESKGELLHHMLFITSYNTGFFDCPIWSLVHEMRISIIFPFIMYIIIKFNWRWIIILSIALLLTSKLLHKFYHDSNYIDTLLYMPLFALGAILNKHNVAIYDFYKNVHINIRKMFIFLFFVWLTIRGIIDSSQYFWLINTVIASVYVSFLIVCSLNVPQVRKILSWNIFVFMGKVSYSVYLYHFIALYAVTYLLFGVIALPMIIFISLMTTIFMSLISYYIIEVNSIRLGKYLSKISEKDKLI